VSKPQDLPIPSDAPSLGVFLLCPGRRLDRVAERVFPTVFSNKGLRCGNGLLADVYQND
jgi:hypothetical protein